MQIHTSGICERVGILISISGVCSTSDEISFPSSGEVVISFYWCKNMHVCYFAFITKSQIIIITHTHTHTHTHTRIYIYMWVNIVGTHLSLNLVNVFQYNGCYSSWYIHNLRMASVVHWRTVYNWKSCKCPTVEG